jgi:hypothetical protein
MNFVLDPESAFEALLQGVQGNKGVWANYKHKNKNQNS